MADCCAVDTEIHLKRGEIHPENVIQGNIWTEKRDVYHGTRYFSQILLHHAKSWNQCDANQKNLGIKTRTVELGVVAFNTPIQVIIAYFLSN